MNIFANKRTAGSGLVFKLSPVAAGCAIFASALAGTASAQTAVTEAAADAPVQTVTVTGIRRAIETAIATKRDATGIVEAISAEDIGKLPDVSIAESLARLPGLSSQRVNGQAQQISIRGTSGDLSTALLNGREQVSTSANRTVEYDQYPSELINAVTVYKTSDAGVVGQGLSGTVDMQTIKPLSLRERAISVNVRGEKNSAGSISAGSPDTGSRVSASYIDQFANRTIGVAIGYARQDKPNVSRQFETWDWVDNSAVAPGSTVKVPKGIKALATTGDQVRDGLMGVLEWRPNKNFSSTLDMYHSRFDQEEIRRGMEIPLQDDGSVVFANPTIVNGVMVAGNANNVNPVVRNNRMKRDDKLSAIGWNNRFTSGAWVGIIDLSSSKADHKEELVEINAGRAVRQTLGFDYRNGAIPNLNLSGTYDDPSQIAIGGQFGEGYVNAPNLTDKLHSARASVEYKFAEGAFSSVEVGFNLSKRSKDKEHLETGFSKIGAGTFAANVVNGSQDLYGLPNTLSWDIPGVLAQNFGPYAPSVLVPWGATKNWTIDEKVKTGYVKLNIDTELMAMPLRGNVGVQVVKTDQSSTANTLRAWPFADLVPLTDGKKYTDYLPSLNLAWSLPDQQFIRFGAGKTLARAKLNELNAALEVGLTAQSTGTPWGNGGNAQLDPWRAKQVDLSWEKYFGNKGYVSVAGFHKKLDSYIYQLTGPRDFSEYRLVGATADIGTMTQPMNGEGGKLQGLELAASAPLDMLHPMLDGFGVTANASFTNSEIEVKDQRFGSMAIPLPGLSKRVFNLTAYYEANGFSARVSQRYRSDFVGEIGGIGGANELTFVKSDKVVDLQLGYDFAQVKGLSVLFQVNNLTDTEFETYAGTKDRPRGYTKYGRQMLLGLNYKL
ncbi:MULTISPECIES: TonB-dependent receptor [unclassified Massilia]|uniref:TonB-dependent receptor n=1 Tax=unclassified Massilia TaxID=2609279 RepID=UPI001786E33B|nr:MULTISPECIES: TonB-dependent receptor [unclassified Massilia]MBD8529800.1 TonB-dependent receptor [Massilia sp. CFBP 13647]MBD8672188.1 TonB-dependent receptor [Massilia sp. CFBP 13721]